WRVDATNPEALVLTAHLFDALAGLGERSLRSGDLGSARIAFERARQLDTRRGGDGSAITLLRKRLDGALVARLDTLVAKPDRAGAEALLAGTRWLGLDAARNQALQARVRTIATSRTPTPASAATVATTVVGAPVPVTTMTVSRADYARFAKATGRDPADCGKGLFGRRLSWSNTGSDAKPVVCVSASDAQAYAAWLGAQEQRRFRLPSAGEMRTQAAKPVSGWVTLCADRACSQRMASGKPQALDASRGYNDVGIRLVREG
ncbi:MAG: hypothetical protein EOP93_03760, partial [Lysobacteraceae bacterium]